jgi:hypothetical protein
MLHIWIKLQFLGNNSKIVNKNRNLTWDKNDQHSKIHLPCNFEVKDGRWTPSDGNSSSDALGQVS